MGVDYHLVIQSVSLVAAEAELGSNYRHNFFRQPLEIHKNIQRRCQPRAARRRDEQQFIKIRLRSCKVDPPQSDTHERKLFIGFLHKHRKNAPRPFDRCLYSIIHIVKRREDRFYRAAEFFCYAPRGYCVNAVCSRYAYRRVYNLSGGKLGFGCHDTRSFHR